MTAIAAATAAAVHTTMATMIPGDTLLFCWHSDGMFTLGSQQCGFAHEHVHALLSAPVEGDSVQLCEGDADNDEPLDGVRVDDAL